MTRKKALVVGSGAGGCMVAKELAGQFDVALLEAGNTFVPFRHKLGMLEPMRRAGMFLDERMIGLLFPEMRILKTHQGLVHVNGRCIGGTTMLATGNAVRCDKALREIGIDLSPEFEELFREVPITCGHYRNWSDLTVRLFMAFEDLGYQPQVTPKFMEDATKCVVCGRCVLGCRFGAKWTAQRLLDACPQVEMLPHTVVERIVIEGGEAKGVLVRQRGKKTSVIAGDVVVLAAGGLNTPLILGASGIHASPSLFVDPVICVAAPWAGAGLDAQLPMPFVSQRPGYILSPYFDWLSFFFNKHWRQPSHDIVSIMVKYADSEQGFFDGKRLEKPVTEHDCKIIERSVEEARAVLDQLGIARTDMFLGTLNAGHPGGCLPLTAAEAHTLHHSTLPSNVYVADASLLPHSMGNPPTLTIMALAKRVARHAADTLGV